MSIESKGSERPVGTYDLFAQFLRRPESAGEIPFDAIPCMLSQLAAVQSLLAARLIERAAAPEASGLAEGDRLLTVEEAAQKLGVASDWLYRRAARLPFTVRLGRALRFSESGLTRWIRSRSGR